MWQPFKSISPSTTEHQASFKLQRPWRRDFTSVPTSSMPASKLSSTK